MIKTLTNLFKQDKEKFVVPKGVQDVIPIKAIYDDGIFQVGKDKFSKSFKFTDINYAVAMLPQMTGRQRYKANALIKRLCANYDGGNCLLLDDGEPCVCVQSISYSLLCKYFRNAVLPAEPKLEAEILMSGAKTVCERCGVPIEKHSNRQKYCADCARIMYLKNKAKYQRNKRSGVDN